MPDGDEQPREVGAEAAAAVADAPAARRVTRPSAGLTWFVPTEIPPPEAPGAPEERPQRAVVPT